MLRTVKWILFGLAAAALVAFLNFYLPSHTIVRIVGTETKRFDSSGWFDSENPNLVPQNTRDVRIINGIYPNGSPAVFRNEDTGWGFPFYFKFDSGNVQAKAQNLQSNSENPRWVSITNYGWRFYPLTMFPNAIDIEPVSGPDARIIPWFNIIVLTILGILAFWIIMIIRRFKREHVDPAFDQIENRFDSAMTSVHRTGADLSDHASATRGRFSRWLGSWKSKPKRPY